MYTVYIKVVSHYFSGILLFDLFGGCYSMVNPMP